MFLKTGCNLKLCMNSNELAHKAFMNLGRTVDIDSGINNVFVCFFLQKLCKSHQTKFMCGMDFLTGRSGSKFFWGGKKTQNQRTKVEQEM